MADLASQEPVQIDRVIIRFAGDSGDGMQLTGERFTSASAVFGNDLSTLPEFPAEIRAPAGTLAGVSAFQVHISDHEITTPGDAPNVLVAMNPAALRSELHRLDTGGTVLVNTDAFDERNLTKAGYRSNPLTDGTLDHYTVYEVPMTSLTKDAVAPLGVKPRDAERSKNFFALGLVSWMYTRPSEPTLKWIDDKFGGKPQVVAANRAAFGAGHAFGETAELFDHPYVVRPAHRAPGTYTNINGNTALALGLVAAGQLSGLPIFLGSYPITPASDILHELSKHKAFGIRTLQCEDEIAGIGSALGASFGGHLGVTTTSGPGVALKSEAMGLAVSLELPLIIVDIQRGGPSTGLPTKTEQADLFQAIFGRNGECPAPVIAARSPADCFDIALEAWRIATRFMTPVFVLTDGYIANGAEPWRVPNADSLPRINVTHPGPLASGEKFMPYARDERLARPWALPGTPGLMHRIGGLEKQDITGNVNYEPGNHEHMIKLRAKKVADIANDIPPQEIDGPESGKLLVISWGGTYGACATATRQVRAKGGSVAHVHLRYLNPLPANLGKIIGQFEKVLVPELNLGQLRTVIRAEYLVDAVGLNKVQGKPFAVREVVEKIQSMLKA